jgi:hypothetical protein
MILKDTEVLTVPCRLAFPSLFVPTSVHPTTPDKIAYQATIVIPPGTDLAPFKAAIVAAMTAQWGKAIKLEGNGMPLKSCDTKSYAGFDDGGYFIKVKSKFAPQVVDQAKQPVMAAGVHASPEELARAVPAAEARVYAGAWCNFYIGCYAWENAAGKGVSFNLNAVQLVRDDVRLDGRKGADDVFGTIEGAETAPVAAAPDDILGDLLS